MSNFPLALKATPHGIPVVGVLCMLGLLAFFVWDALRLPKGLWFRWFMPVGLLPFLAGATFDILWLLLVGVLVMAIGFYMSKSRRQRNDVSWRR